MTNQETFDIVVRHLQKQGGPATYKDSKQCAYRGTNDTKCAAGCLISDEDYRNSMENVSANDKAVSWALSEHDIVLVRALQNAHDMSSEQWSLLPGNLRSIAREWKLSDAEVQS